MDVNQTLAERNRTHGPWGTQAATAAKIKETLRLSPRWNRIPSFQKEALDHIAIKLSRIVNGNSYEADHWHDIIGYATLGATPTVSLPTPSAHPDEPSAPSPTPSCPGEADVPRHDLRSPQHRAAAGSPRAMPEERS